MLIRLACLLLDVGPTLDLTVSTWLKLSRGGRAGASWADPSKRGLVSCRVACLRSTERDWPLALLSELGDRVVEPSTSTRLDWRCCAPVPLLRPMRAAQAPALPMPDGRLLSWSNEGDAPPNPSRGEEALGEKVLPLLPSGVPGGRLP